MAYKAIPDEVLSEILTPALTVDDEMFSHTSDTEPSPFATYTESPSAYLLVNKAWLRVATPLLYGTVVLRSKAQAKALERTLSGNPVLGPFIKRLRVEGGYGALMYRILKLSPNISHLFLSLIIPSGPGDSTDGLCKGLALINPTHLILHDFHDYHDDESDEGNARARQAQVKHKAVSKLVDAIVAAIPGWKRLSSFHCPYSVPYYGDESHNGYFELLADPLLQANRLQTLSAESFRDAVKLYETFKSCPLRSIVVRQRVWYYDVDHELRGLDAALNALLRYKVRREESWYRGTPPRDEQAVDVAPSNPFFKPMNDAPEEVQDRIWSRILHFALNVDEVGRVHRHENGVEEPQYSKGIKLFSNERRVAVLTVSSRFLRLGLPHLCVHVFLSNEESLEKFKKLLSKNPHLKSNIHTLIVRIYPSYYNNDLYQATFHEILSGVEHLRHFSSVTYRDIETVYDDRETAIDWNTFVAVDYGALEHFSMHVGMVYDGSPAVFSRFTNLRLLHWRCDTVFDLKALVVDVDAFPKLEELIVRQSDKSFGIILSRMRLPALTRIRFLLQVHDDALLRAHGSKLSTLELPGPALPTPVTNGYDTDYTKILHSANVLDLCPNLRSLTVCWAYEQLRTRRFQDDNSAFPPDGKAFESDHPATSLVEIIFDTCNPRELSQSALDNWGQFLVNTFPRDSLPALREIRTNAFKWPTTETDIAKSVWVTVAETLASNNVTLKDAGSNTWRPRLKLDKTAGGSSRRKGTRTAAPRSRSTRSRVRGGRK
ncbi:hypothetical protein C8F01DRAFT_768066 [Mycena amicta]|nr:hypothetical protein C8F01DRAFT_768066 [Mycena amicta]